MYKETLSKFILFATGAAIGSVVTWKLVKTKCETEANNRADAEIEAMREHFKKKEEALEEKADDSDEEHYEPTEEDLEGYNDIINKAGYTRYSNGKESTSIDPRKPKSEKDKPYEITADEFGGFADYQEVYLTYYSDGYVVDDDDEPVDDIEDTIGYEALNPFADGTIGVLYIRNDAKKTDYEISYSSVIYKEYADE